MGNKAKRRRVHKELDEAIKRESKRNGKSEMEYMKALGMRLKKKKKKLEWGFNFRV